MKSGTFNVLKTAPVTFKSGEKLFYATRNDRLMLGMSCDRETAEFYLGRYRERYPAMSFELVDDAPPTTCEIPVQHATAQ